MKPVNLLPQDQRRRRPSGDSGGKGAYALLGVLALLVGMVAAYVVVSNQVTERENEAAVAGAEADRLEAQAATQANYSDFAQIAQMRMQSVAGVATTRFDWERLMRELSRIMPEGSWLQSTDASVTGETGSGDEAAAAPAPGTTSSAPSANLVGCTPDQEDVADMMVRMRQMHRVEDVGLNESTREQGGDDPSPDNCGTYYKFDLTVTFSAAGPANETPRGAERVPASLGGGS
jgi:Tfp pilus assembly protein PilN